MATITVGGDQILNVSSALDSNTIVDVQRFGTLNVLSGGLDDRHDRRECRLGACLLGGVRHRYENQ